MRYIKQQKPFVQRHDTVESFDALFTTLSSRRITFTEAEVLSPLWQQGEDARLREDARFWQLECGHWHLAQQKLANEILIERLQSNVWDGRELEGYLARLDEEFDRFHVFCPTDARLVEQGSEWRLADAEILPSLPGEIKSRLDGLASELVESWRVSANGHPWQTQQVLDALQALGWAPDQDPTGVVTAWMLSRAEDWARVGRDLWIPQSELPNLQNIQRYYVQVITGEPLSSQTDNPFGVEIKAQGDSEEEEGETEGQVFPPVERDKQGQVSWRIALRTVHLNNGYIPVPSEARFLYPRLATIASRVFLYGVWYDDGSHFHLWLDCETHRLFGDQLAELIGLLDVGTILRIRWNETGLVMSTEGVDEQVNAEEARLANPTALEKLRRGVGESYRQSLRQILLDAPDGLPLAELYRRVCERQQHTAHRGSVQAILYCCPEFYRLGRVWKIKSEVDGAATLRELVVKLGVSNGKALAALLQAANMRIDKMLSDIQGMNRV